MTLVGKILCLAFWQQHFTVSLENLSASEHEMEQKQPLQQMVLGDLDSYVQKNETRSPTYAIHKNKFKMDKRLKYKS